WMIIQTRMRSRKAKVIIFIIASVSVAVGVLSVISVRNAALRALEVARKAASTSQLVPIERIELKPYSGNDAKIIQSGNEVRDLTQFRDSLFAATSGGLIRLSSEGEMLRQYTVLDGLPESDLTSAAVYHDTLFIGTRSKGLVAFDGEHFSNFRWI